MKTLLIALLTVTAFSGHVMAAQGKCQEKISIPALKRINKIYTGDSARTRTIEGVKLLHLGSFLETYSVAASDEVEPSEWIAVVDTKSCAIKFIDVSDDGSWSDIWDDL